MVKEDIFAMGARAQQPDLSFIMAADRQGWWMKYSATLCFLHVQKSINYIFPFMPSTCAILGKLRYSAAAIRKRKEKSKKKNKKKKKKQTDEPGGGGTHL